MSTCIKNWETLEISQKLGIVGVENSQNLGKCFKSLSGIVERFALFEER